MEFRFFITELQNVIPYNLLKSYLQQMFLFQLRIILPLPSSLAVSCTLPAKNEIWKTRKAIHGTEDGHVWWRWRLVRLFSRIKPLIYAMQLCEYTHSNITIYVFITCMHSKHLLIIMNKCSDLFNRNFDYKRTWLKNTHVISSNVFKLNFIN